LRAKAGSAKQRYSLTIIAKAPPEIPGAFFENDFIVFVSVFIL